MLNPDQRELLTLAAQAVGMDLNLRWRWRGGLVPCYCLYWQDEEGEWHITMNRWNPLIWREHAFDIQVKLRFLVNVSSEHTEVTWFDEVKSETHSVEQWANDMTMYECTQLALVRAAAEYQKRISKK